MPGRGRSDRGRTASGPADRDAAGLGRRILALVRGIPDHPSPGVVFRDITPLLADPPVFAQVVAAIAALCPAGTPDEVDLVAGIEARGLIIASPVALVLGAGFIPIRKQGKLPHATVRAQYALEYGEASIELHTDAVRPGQRVLLVDDVLATGGTAAAAAGLLEEVGGTVSALAFLLELDALGGRRRLAGRRVQSLAHV